MSRDRNRKFKALNRYRERINQMHDAITKEKKKVRKMSKMKKISEAPVQPVYPDPEQVLLSIQLGDEVKERVLEKLKRMAKKPWDTFIEQRSRSATNASQFSMLSESGRSRNAKGDLADVKENSDKLENKDTPENETVSSPKSRRTKKRNSQDSLLQRQRSRSRSTSIFDVLRRSYSKQFSNDGSIHPSEHGSEGWPSEKMKRKLLKKTRRMKSSENILCDCDDHGVEEKSRLLEDEERKSSLMEDDGFKTALIEDEGQNREQEGEQNKTRHNTDFEDISFSWV